MPINLLDNWLITKQNNNNRKAQNLRQGESAREWKNALCLAMLKDL